MRDGALWNLCGELASDVCVAHLVQCIQDIGRHFLRAEQKGVFPADHKISQRTALYAKIHQRTQIIPMPQLLAKFFNERQNLDALNRKRRLISAKRLAPKAQHHAFAVHRPAKYSDRHIGQLPFHLIIDIQLRRRQKVRKKILAAVVGFVRQLCKTFAKPCFFCIHFSSPYKQILTVPSTANSPCPTEES